MKTLLLSMLSLALLTGTALAQEIKPEPRIGVAWGFLYGYQSAPAAVYMPQVRELGSGFSKIYLLWNQIEPKKGEFNFASSDAYVNQLQSREEGLIAIFSTSTWATQKSAEILPPAPAKDLKEYYHFVHTLVSRYKGKVKYWQNDCEPNNAIYWAGTPAEFVAQLKVFHKAVKDADPDALVVVGGYDGLFNPPGTFQMPTQEAGLAFFDLVIKEAKDSFDLFDLRLYANPYTIEYRVNFMRDKMKAQGYERPIICTEYNGPNFFEFAPNLQYVAVVQAWSAQVASGNLPAGAQNPIAEMYKNMSTLAPQTQLFMDGAPAELQKKFFRIQGRDMVIRNVFAIVAGVERTLFWDFVHDASNRDDLMHLMYSKHRIMDYQDGKFVPLPPAETFSRMAKMFAGVTTAKRIEGTAQDVYAFNVERTGRPKLIIVWQQRDTFTGEDTPAITVELPFAGSAKVKAVDALGATIEASVADGTVKLPVSLTPIYVEAQ